MSKLAMRIKELRKKLGISQSELAEKISVSHFAISRYERDKTSPDPETISKLADFFGVTTDYLLGRTDDPSTLLEKELFSPTDPKQQTIDQFTEHRSSSQQNTDEIENNDLNIALHHIEQRLDRIEHHLALITGFGIDELLLLRRLKEHPKMIPWLMEFIEAPEETKEKTMRVWAAFLPDDQYWVHYRRLREELGLVKEKGDGKEGKEVEKET